MRRKKLPNTKGIYQDTKSGKLQCQKRIKGKLYSESFSNIKEAKNWVKNFHPDSDEFVKIEINDFSGINGKKSCSVKEVWNKYKEEHISFLELTTQEVTLRSEFFLRPIFHLDVKRINPQIISKLINSHKRECIEKENKKRFNFNSELRTSAALFTWWKTHYDFTYSCPVIRKIHWPLGVIKKTNRNKSKKMDISIVAKFLKQMYKTHHNRKVFAMLSEIQFLTTSRIQDIACIKSSQVDFDSGILVVDKARAFTRTKNSSDYDKTTKNGEAKVMELTERMRSIFAELINLKHPDCDYIFHLNGKPLTYRQIQYAYNKSLKEIGVYPQFSSTHILRHASAYSVRELLSLDHAQAMGGWKSVKLAEHYSGLSSKLTGEGSRKLENRLKLIQ